MFFKSNVINRIYFAVSLLLASLNSHAELTSYNPNGVDLVYSSVSDVTWTKDANLLGSMIANQGFDTVVNAIISSSPTITNTPNGYISYNDHSFDRLNSNYTVTKSDFFDTSGRTTWWGAVAFSNYLNSISYAGINRWHLPTVKNKTDGFDTAINGIAKGDEFVEVFYHELYGEAYYNMPNTVFFDNETIEGYWTGTEAVDAELFANYRAHIFITVYGLQANSFKDMGSYAWVISPGKVAAVPEPESAAMLLVAFGLISLVSLSRKANK